ncbi:MAG: oxygen-dependent coproporphyrinogen oxidase [Opitutales bacterium]|nr:oxygen-dependent coproporphyrinogen oxidase [Opitutales bacterium]
MQIDQAETVKSYLLELQKSLANQLTKSDPSIELQEDQWKRQEGGGGKTLSFTNGQIIEKGGINFSDVSGTNLPKTATQNRPELEGASFRGMGVSVVFHPDNPFIPTTHANVRYFEARKEDQTLSWWFGGGFDLTPYYPFKEDVVEWHQKAKSTCDPFGEDLYIKLKKWCDEYFYLPHRNETRGVGGIFFDDFCEDGFDSSFSFMQSVGKSFQEAYFTILERRKEIPFTEKEKDFQKYRRGRYAEFNLVYDRGTHFGLQSKGRTESILMSMPPEVNWVYGFTPPKNSPEENLYENYLHPNDWLEVE